MTLPEKTRLESMLEWGYKHKFLVPHLMRTSFKARTGKSPVLVNWNKGIKLLSIGNSHIDAAWLWRKEDTRKKKINVTFDRALLHMSTYPEFTYTQNQAVYYEWTKELYPEIWEGIKQRFKEGRWEVLGGDWVECDANIPSVESLVRQRIAGQRFFLEEFGFVSEIAWADDVFGFPHCYPQILAKSGAKYFYTNKFCYNEVNKFPYHVMLWKSPDGSYVLTYWMQHKNSWARWLNTFKELSVLLRHGESVELNYMANLDAARASFSDETLPIIGNMYGHGDGGNGPKPAEIIEQLCWQRQGFAKLGTTAELFAMLEPYRARLPSWNDELYLECHQGTLTSIHMIKENNRTAEVLLRSTEFLNTLSVLGGGKDYQPEIRELWKVCLFNQFHDVLPGSSIPEVYRDAALEYRGLFERLYNIRDEISGVHAKNVERANKASFTIINDLSWARGGVVTVKLSQLLKDISESRNNFEFSVRDQDGHQYPCQLVSFPHHDANREFIAQLGMVTGTNYMKSTDGNQELESYVHRSGKNYLWILLTGERAINGFDHLDLEISWREREGSTDSDAGTAMKSTSISEEMTKLENGAISVQINTRSGCITGVSAPGGALVLKDAGLTLYEDPHTRFDAWNLDPDYFNHPAQLPTVESTGIDHYGPVMKSALLKTKPSSAGTTFYHRIYIVEGQPIVYHEILVNWQEDHKLLKYKVEPMFYTESVRCGMQFGSIVRATVPKNRFTDYKAKYEYPVQQWSSVDGMIDGKDACVTLLNRNKYGMFCRGSTMELTLLKSAQFEKHTSAASLDPDDPRPLLIDRGFWRLSVATMIGHEHVGRIDSWRAGEEFNTPFSSLGGAMVKSMPLSLHDDTGSVSLTAVKVLDDIPGGENPHPEWYLDKKDGETWILARLAEQEGKQGQLTITVDESIPVQDWVELDLLERKIDGNAVPSLENAGNRIKIDVKPHELKTIAIKVKNNEKT